jgi:hypothetical protein
MQEALTPTAASRGAAAEAAPRLDLYATIHKALRAAMTDTLGRVGRLDTDDPAEMAATLGQLDELLALCASHIAHENEFLHPAIEARAPGGARRVAGEHVEHLEAIEALNADNRALRAAEPRRRPVLALRLYRHLALFVADNFQHMHHEETAHNAALWAAYGDDELLALHGALVASIPPQEMMAVLGWMVPALCPAERAGLLADLRATMPPPAFAAVIDAIQPRLDPCGWRKLAGALGLAPVPGLVQRA